MHYATRIYAFALAAMILAEGTAHAQSLVSNEVYIGQTGETNTVRIEQDGNGNNVGANRDILRFNQNGLDNLIDIYQYGYSNSVGATLRDVRRAAYGLDQIGDSNSLTIEQRNQNPMSGDIVEAIYQNSSSDISHARNILVIRQETLGAGAIPYNHRVGQVVQRDFSTTTLGGGMRAPSETMSLGLGDNVISIVQTGGGAVGGNTVESLMQEGTANAIAIEQSLDRNEIERVTQIGALNEISIDQSGSDNYVFEVAQNNEGQASLGSKVGLNFAANGTGRSAVGVPGAFGESAGRLGIEQAAVFQTGDGNDVNFAVAEGDNNLYGFEQIGDGNGILGIIEGTDNEVAVSQSGDGNGVDSDLDGYGNVVAAQQIGERNRIRTVLTGIFNNSVSFRTPLAAIAADLLPGMFVQLGDDNVIELVMTGERQSAAVRQQGDFNVALGMMAGSDNQALVVQTGSSNYASLTQNGQNNTVRVLQ